LPHSAGGQASQLTLRDRDEARLLARLQAVLAQYPLQQVTGEQVRSSGRTQGQDWCAVHHVAMRWNEGKEGRKGWYSHRTAEGWCKGK
jgi:hypothetical protein